MQQLPQLNISARCALGLFSGCRMISRSVIKSTVQVLVDYTPEDSSINQVVIATGLIVGTVDSGNEYLRTDSSE